jgi:hypothetical protein
MVLSSVKYTSLKYTARWYTRALLLLHTAIQLYAYTCTAAL